MAVMLTESYKKRLARKYNDKNFRTKNIRVLVEAVDRTKTEYNYIYDAYDLTKKQRVCLKLMSEMYNVPPNQLILQEDIYKKLSSFWRKLTGSMPQDAALDVSADKSPLHNKLIAQAAKEQLDGSNFIKRAKRGWAAGKRSDKRGEGFWGGYGVGSKFRSAVADMSSNFQFGVHGGVDNEKLDAIRGEFAGLVDDFEATGKAAAKDLVAKIHKAAEESNFPNNPSAEEFCKILFGHSHIDDLEGDNTEAGGILGAIFAFREDLQELVNKQSMPVDVANALLDQLRRILKNYAGQVKDSYASRLIKTSEGVFGRDDLLYNDKYNLKQRLLEANEDNEDQEGGEEIDEEQAKLIKDSERFFKTKQKQSRQKSKQLANKIDITLNGGKYAEKEENFPDKLIVKYKDKDGKEVEKVYQTSEVLSGTKTNTKADLNKPNASMGQKFTALFKKFMKNKKAQKIIKPAVIDQAIKTNPEYKKLLQRKDLQGKSLTDEAYEKIMADIKKNESVLGPLIFALVGTIGMAMGAYAGGSVLGNFAADTNVQNWIASLPGTNVMQTASFLADASLPISTTGHCFTGVLYDIGPTYGTTFDVANHTSTLKDAKAVLIQAFGDGTTLTHAQLQAGMPSLNVSQASFDAMMDPANSTQAIGDFFHRSGTFNGILPGSEFYLGASKVFVKQLVMMGGRYYVANTFYAMGASAMGGTSLAGAVSGVGGMTVIATGGTAIAAAALAIVAFRKLGTKRNRRNMIMSLVDLIKPIEGASKPIDPDIERISPVDTPPVVNPTKDPNLKASFDLVVRFLKKKGYNPKDALKLMQALYNPKTKLGRKSFKDFYDESESQQNLRAHYSRTGKYSLLAVLSEDISYKRYAKRMKRAAKKAKVPFLNDEQLRAAAIAINNAYIIGDIDETTFPKDIMEKVIEVESEELKKKYEDALKENEELDRIMKNAVESAAAEIGVQAETIQQLKAKLDAAIKKGNLSESQLQMAIRTIQGLEQQVAALQKNVDEDIAYLYGEMYVMHEILKKIMNNPELKIDDNEEKKMSDMYEKLIARLDLEGSAEYTKFLENGTSIGQLNSIFAKIDETPNDFLEDVMNLTSYLNELHAKYMAAKSSEKKYEGDLGNLHTLYLALSGVSKILDNEGNVTADVEQARSTGNIAGALDAATNTKALDKYNRIRKTFKRKGFDVPADERADMIKDFSDEMSKGFDAVGAAVEKGGNVRDDGAEAAYFKNKKRKYPHAPFPADSALEKKFAKQAERRRKDRERKRKKRLQAWKTNDGNLLIERWQKLAGLK